MKTRGSSQLWLSSLLKTEKEPPMGAETILAIIPESLFSRDLQSSSLSIAGLDEALLRKEVASSSISKNVACCEAIISFFIFF